MEILGTNKFNANINFLSWEDAPQKYTWSCVFMKLQAVSAKVPTC